MRTRRKKDSIETAPSVEIPGPRSMGSATSSSPRIERADRLSRERFAVDGQRNDLDAETLRSSDDSQE